MDTFTIALAQMDCAIADTERNLCRCINLMDTAARQGARLIVFPEAALTGYGFASLDEARPYAQPVPGPSTERITAKCRSANMLAVVGLLEADGDRVYNAAALMGPAGYIGKYRKLHLPFLGVDRFVTPGDAPPAVFDTPLGNIGMLICYDLRFPEAARVLALSGADLIVVPTNWPKGAESNSQILMPARALENQAYVAACDRTGDERGFHYIGMSGVAGPDGRWLVQTQSDAEQLLYATVEPARAREKKLVRIPGEWEIDPVNDRRPAMYGRLTER
ncbi:MAG: carbon-nitrogen hydrolase family protein [Bacteroidetes bacterium]|nr:carbon-nitrogen hydrolase family protein [Bacteroidota bacterium]MCL5027360.1 carbon-nitrogen hydrolase family protein [Chloroflexota bacterium]